MMICKLKVAFVFGMLVLSCASAHAQGAVAGAAVGVGIGLPGIFVGAGVPINGDADFSLMLPVPVSIDDLNGATDRFGMPIMGRFVKGSATGTPANEDMEAGVDAPRRNFSRTNSTLKRNPPRAKDVKRPARAGASSAAAPQYLLPRGSLEWNGGDGSLDLSPANRYGYGYGFSGYGTEVFGDFWKGWPTVQ